MIVIELIYVLIIKITYIILLLIVLLLGYIAFKECSKSAKQKNQQIGYKFAMNYYSFLGILAMIFSISYIGKLIFEIVNLFR